MGRRKGEASWGVMSRLGWRDFTIRWVHWDEGTQRRVFEGDSQVGTGLLWDMKVPKRVDEKSRRWLFPWRGVRSRDSMYCTNIKNYIFENSGRIIKSYDDRTCIARWFKIFGIDWFILFLSASISNPGTKCAGIQDMTCCWSTITMKH